ncbi:MAG: hypothetical protein R2911_41050 [Caldilineaceae bacterium]
MILAQIGFVERTMFDMQRDPAGVGDSRFGKRWIERAGIAENNAKRLKSVSAQGRGNMTYDSAGLTILVDHAIHEMVDTGIVISKLNLAIRLREFDQELTMRFFRWPC